VSRQTRCNGRLDATPTQVALAWLLRRASNILLIAGTSSLAHLRENIGAAALELSNDAVTALDALGPSGKRLA
jgi:aryl-alcohol dehydrogenase-like predicted oxidoreductase